MELIRDKLGPWQYQCFRRMKYKIKGLEKEISKLMDGPTNEGSLSILKCARSNLGHLYDVEEKYWALRARMIHENILVAHELMHYLRSSKNGPNKGCVVKLDMSKAYDRVEWSFLEKVLKKMGFSHIWINKIMDYVCTVRYRVKCNTILFDIIVPERGLRQGDPLSPYLFFFCMDALSRMLIYAQNTNQIKGIRASKDGPRINHLFFADDALLFVKNKRSEVEAFTKILDSFERMSGQSINLDKSMVYFSPNTPVSQRTSLSGLLRMKVVANLDSYLGLPIPIGKKKSAAFQSILDHAASRIESWSKRLLSLGGKEIFIKSILQSIPTYGFSVFFVPNGILEELQSLIYRVWWGEKIRKEVGICYLGTACVILKEWGSRVPEFGPQVWHLMCCRDTLCFRVLSAKYFPDGDVFHPKRIDKPSFTWQSITKAASLLYEGFGWNVGKGSRIDIWHDRWGFEGLSGDSIGLRRRDVQEEKVCDLLNSEKDDWNEGRVIATYGKDLGDQICKIPIIHNGPEDSRVWFHNPFGFYSTKSAYSWLTLKHVGFGPHRVFWTLPWKLQTLPKVKIFCWHLGHDILPTYENISSIRREFNSNCPSVGLLWRL
ncbi:uncharacterized protein [Gossypium hirsutum]|uniref:Reverse transcriptase domain-containing protein n=1 Tax=Gossypium hirsutum TaxID=3635 RepID=A0A1U8IJ46_GOSHI|nr:uncharacterized protein LOC107895635 [Gossypium hirsutum]